MAAGPSWQRLIGRLVKKCPAWQRLAEGLVGERSSGAGGWSMGLERVKIPTNDQIGQLYSPRTKTFHSSAQNNKRSCLKKQ